MSGLISLNEASKISGYHQDYLSYLIRKNKLNGEKIGRAWCVTEDDLRKFILEKNTGVIKGSVKNGNNSADILKIKKISLVLFFVLLGFLLFFELKETNTDNINKNKEKGFVVDTIYSETSSEVSSQISTKN